MQSFIPVSADSDFSLQNLPFGIFSTDADPTPKIGVAIGDQVLDVRPISKAGLLSGPIMSGSTCLEQSTLNDFMSLGRPAWRETRATLQRLLSADEGTLRDNPALRASALLPQASVHMHLPATIGDYTDFFCSREHATNCGVMFRGPEHALQPNWLHLPVAYHSRASSIVVSGTDVRRPWGQVQHAAGENPDFQPSSVLDFELEMGCFIGPGNELGSPISLDDAEDHMFGLVLVNDWSARDIQRWEYIPLGPFNAKNWATTISPWVVTLEALEPFRSPAPVQDPTPLAYLNSASKTPRCNYDVRLEASITPGALGSPEGEVKESSSSGKEENSSKKEESSCARSGEAVTVTRSNLHTLYWTIPQMVAHHTAGGCNLRPGDLIATGTLSIEGQGGQGSLLELSWNGRRKVDLGNGVERTFLEDGDEVTLHGYCQGEGFRVGFGKCTGKVLPALKRNN